MKRKRPKTATTPNLRLGHACLSLVATCVLLLLTFAAVSEGRERPKEPESAVIFGTVWGPQDAALPGVKVKVRRAGDKKARWEHYSNRRGEFELVVPAGKQDYIIWADVKGYKLPNGKRLQPSPEVTVHVENNERVDTGLHLK